MHEREKRPGASLAGRMRKESKRCKHHAVRRNEATGGAPKPRKPKRGALTTITNGQRLTEQKYKPTRNGHLDKDWTLGLDEASNKRYWVNSKTGDYVFEADWNAHRHSEWTPYYDRDHRKYWGSNVTAETLWDQADLEEDGATEELSSKESHRYPTICPPDAADLMEPQSAAEYAQCIYNYHKHVEVG